VTIKGGDNFLSPPYFLTLLNLITQEERSLLEDDYSVGSGHIDAGLIVYNTSRYTGTTHLYPSDLEIYEIATGTTRRLTTQEGYVAVQRLAYPYLLILRFVGGQMYMNDFYVANLVALGVTDGLGQLIPGDPVIETP
jgi:hypothetical protein